MIWTPSPRPPRSQWLTNLILRDAIAFISLAPSLSTKLRRLRRLQPAAEKQLTDALIGEDALGAVLHARRAELEHDAEIRLFQSPLGVLLDHQHGDAARAHVSNDPEQLLHQDRR